MALHFTATSAMPAAECTRILPMTQHADNIWNEGEFLPLLLKMLSLYTYTFLALVEDFLQEYLKFPCQCFLSVLLTFEGYCCKLCPSNNPRRKNHKDYFSSVSARCICFVFLSIKSPTLLSLFTKLWIVCLLGILSSWNLHRNFRRHFPSDLYLT
jgi:hypothetical protein